MDAKEDLFNLLNEQESHSADLRQAVIEGRIDGIWPNISVATKRGCVKAHLGISPGVQRSPIEAFVYNVRTGDNPTNSPALRSVLEWISEWESGRMCDF